MPLLPALKCISEKQSGCSRAGRQWGFSDISPLPGGTRGVGVGVEGQVSKERTVLREFSGLWLMNK